MSEKSINFKSMLEDVDAVQKNVQAGIDQAPSVPEKSQGEQALELLTSIRDLISELVNFDGEEPGPDTLPDEQSIPEEPLADEVSRAESPARQTA